MNPRGEEGHEAGLLAYRLSLLEDGHTELASAVGDLRDFANSLRAYARVALFVWPVAQAAITALVVVAVMNLVGKG